MKYIELDINLKERLKFLFFGLIREDVILRYSGKHYSKTSEDTYVPKSKHKIKKEDTNGPDIDNVIVVEDDTEGIMGDIPFFDLNPANVKSNIKE